MNEGTQRRGRGYAYAIGQLSGVWMFMLEQGIRTWEGNNKEVSRGDARFLYLLTYHLSSTSWDDDTSQELREASSLLSWS